MFSKQENLLYKFIELLFLLLRQGGGNLEAQEYSWPGLRNLGICAAPGADGSERDKSQCGLSPPRHSQQWGSGLSKGQRGFPLGEGLKGSRKE